MSTSISQTPISSPRRWDVFLSFRGSDTRNTFTSHLYAALDRYGIRTNKDDRRVIQAIKESKSYVVVLSENYASSCRCLDELVEILNCCKTTGGSVIPVFYNIDPLIVRHQIGSYKEAFEKHQIGFEMEKVKNWRRALYQVADFRGKQVSQNRYEIDIINEIADEILLKLNPTTLYVAKYPVGLDSRVKTITALCTSSTEGIHGMGVLGKTTLAEKLSIYGMGEPGKTTPAKKIGIYGMGGVGKTTLAKAVYNENYNRFQGSCFLENVREVSRKEGLECLQQQLINNVLKCQNINIYNIDQGIEFIRARISSIKVLIVLDDLDDPRQLEYLEGRFCLGSIMIITTRNEDLLDLIEVEARYKVNELDDEESLQLFSLHAFGDNRIPDTFIELSQEILQRVGGLPLALKVFGSNLLDQCEEEMISVDKLKQVSIDDVEKKLKISFDDVNEKLLISFDALKLVDPMLQDIFLDIACFFIGRGTEEVVEILDSYYSYVVHRIDILQKRCLVTINNRNEFVMHNLIRDMGRKVIRKSSPHEPGKHSRVSVSKDICDVLKNDKVVSSSGNGTMDTQSFKEENQNFSDFSFQPQIRPASSTSSSSFIPANTNSVEESLKRKQGGWNFEEPAKKNEFRMDNASVKPDVGTLQRFSPEMTMNQANMQSNVAALQSNSVNHAQLSQSSQTNRDQSKLDDGYNWRKYGQKQVEGSNNPRSYYKCTYLNCPTKKKVETTFDGHIAEIVYKGNHNHSKPQSTKRSSSQSYQNSLSTIPETSLLENGRSEPMTTPENSSLSLGEDDLFEQGSMTKPGYDDENEPDSKRWKSEYENNETMSSLGSRAVREQRIVVQTTSEIDLLGDGHRWRKYGQKFVLGNPNPRHYYRCTQFGCQVRKNVQRASHDPRAVITTYVGKHNHDHDVCNAPICAGQTQTAVLPQMVPESRFLKSAGQTQTGVSPQMVPESRFLESECPTSTVFVHDNSSG